jgi:hypothetical protein
MNSSLYESMLLRIRDRQKTYLGSIASGSFQSFEEYKLCAGKLKGLEEAEAIVKEAYRNMIEGGK